MGRMCPSVKLGLILIMLQLYLANIAALVEATPNCREWIEWSCSECSELWQELNTAYFCDKNKLRKLEKDSLNYSILWSMLTECPATWRVWRTSCPEERQASACELGQLENAEFRPVGGYLMEWLSDPCSGINLFTKLIEERKL